MLVENSTIEQLNFWFTLQALYKLVLDQIQVMVSVVETEVP